MRKIFLLTFIIFILSNCSFLDDINNSVEKNTFKYIYKLKNQFQEISNNPQNVNEIINYNYQDFFQLRINEHLDLIRDKEGEDSDLPYRKFEQSYVKNESERCKTNDNRQKISEETYLYLDNLSEIDSKSGRALYFVTTPMVSENRREKYFNDTILYTNTFREILVGSWFRSDFVLDDNTIVLVFERKSKQFVMKAEYDNSSIRVKEISHPETVEIEDNEGHNNRLSYDKVVNRAVFMELDNTLELSGNGLVFWNICPKKKFLHSIHIEQEPNKIIGNVDKIGIDSSDFKLYFNVTKPDSVSQISNLDFNYEFNQKNVHILNMIDDPDEYDKMDELPKLPKTLKQITQISF